MPRARRGVVSPADAAAARKRLLDAQLGEAKAAKAAKSSKAKSQTPVAALPKSERVDPPGSPATSTSAPGNKKVELKPIAPPVRPEPKAAPEEECKACQGAHRAHTCGKSRATPTPRRQKTQATPSSANHSKPTRKRRATTKVAKQPKTADEKPNSKAPGSVSIDDDPGSARKRVKSPTEPKKEERGRKVVRPDARYGETLNEADLERQAGVLSELEWWRSEEREEPDEPGSFYEEHLVQRKVASERKSRVPPAGIGHKMVSKIRLGIDADVIMDSGTAVRSSDKHWGQIKLSPSVTDLGYVSPSFPDDDPDSALEPLRPREMSLDWQPGAIPVDPAEVDSGDRSVSDANGDDVVGSDEMMHSPLQTMQDSALPEPSATLASGGELDDWW